jgi:crossover junction endodeoxyribonuclease RusA
VILFEVWVPGVPAPQGSKTRMPNGAMVEGGSTTGRERLRNWRNAVTAGAAEAWEGMPTLDRQPLMLEVHFRMPRPKARRHDVWHATKPDGAKLIRSTEDALVDAGVIGDDAWICQHVASKRYCDRDRNNVGAFIRLRTPASVVILDLDAEPEPDGGEPWLS